MNFIDWITNNYMTVLDGVAYFLLGSIVIVGFFNGPKAGQVRSILERLVDVLRGIGAGTYKDEPGTASVPFKGDSKKRIATVVDE